MAEYVKYIGLSGIRKISQQSWEKAGVKGQETVRWDKKNRWSVPVEKLNDAALELLSKEKGFVLPESKKPAESSKPAKKSTE